MNSLDIARNGHDQWWKILYLRKIFWKPLNGIWMLIHILTGCAVSPAFPCSPVSISSMVCCFVLSASSRVGLGDVWSRIKNCWIWFWVHIKGSLKEEKKWRSCPANCLKDVLKRGMKRLTLLQGALGALSLTGFKDEPKIMHSTTIWEYHCYFPLLCLGGNKLWGQDCDSFILEPMITWRVMCPTLVLQNRGRSTEVESKSNKQREQSSAAFAREHIWLCCFATECLKIFTSK